MEVSLSRCHTTAPLIKCALVAESSDRGYLSYSSTWSTCHELSVCVIRASNCPSFDLLLLRGGVVSMVKSVCCATEDDVYPRPCRQATSCLERESSAGVESSPCSDKPAVDLFHLRRNLINPRDLFTDSRPRFHDSGHDKNAYHTLKTSGSHSRSDRSTFCVSTNLADLKCAWVYNSGHCVTLIPFHP